MHEKMFWIGLTQTVNRYLEKNMKILIIE
jgi:hypothetical protein